MCHEDNTRISAVSGFTKINGRELFKIKNTTAHRHYEESHLISREVPGMHVYFKYKSSDWILGLYITMGKSNGNTNPDNTEYH